MTSSNQDDDELFSHARRRVEQRDIASSLQHGGYELFMGAPFVRGNGRSAAASLQQPGGNPPPQASGLVDHLRQYNRGNLVPLGKGGNALIPQLQEPLYVIHRSEAFTHDNRSAMYVLLSNGPDDKVGTEHGLLVMQKKFGNYADAEKWRTVYHGIRWRGHLVVAELITEPVIGEFVKTTSPGRGGKGRGPGRPPRGR